MTKRTGWPSTSRHDRGYGWEWDQLRLQVLKRDAGLCHCQRCQGGKVFTKIATEVHHVVSREDAARRGWTKEQTEAMSNLQAINSECHKRETAAAQGRELKAKQRIGIDGYPIDQGKP